MRQIDARTDRYDITVRSKDGKSRVSRTVKLIACHDAKQLSSRGSRVWEVQRVECGVPVGEHMVLKDSWVFADRPREGDNYTSIRAFPRDEWERKEFDSFFLSIDSYGDVYSTNSDGVERPEYTQMAPVGRFNVHHRIVYRELCTSIDEPRVNGSAEGLRRLKTVHHGKGSFVSNGHLLSDVRVVPYSQPFIACTKPGGFIKTLAGEICLFTRRTATVLAGGTTKA